MDGGRIVGGILVVLVVIGGLYYKYGAKDRVGEQAKRDVIVLMHKLPDYSSYEGLYEQLVETHSKEIFDRHASMHSVGRRSVRVDFDEEAYLDELFEAMAADAEAQGYKKQAAEIRALAAADEGTPQPAVPVRGRR